MRNPAKVHPKQGPDKFLAVTALGSDAETPPLTAAGLKSELRHIAQDVLVVELHSMGRTIGEGLEQAVTEEIRYQCSALLRQVKSELANLAGALTRHAAPHGDGSTGASLGEGVTVADLGHQRFVSSAASDDFQEGEKLLQQEAGSDDGSQASASSPKLLFSPPFKEAAGSKTRRVAAPSAGKKQKQMGVKFKVAPEVEEGPVVSEPVSEGDDTDGEEEDKESNSMCRFKNVALPAALQSSRVCEEGASGRKGSQSTYTNVGECREIAAAVSAVEEEEQRVVPKRRAHLAFGVESSRRLKAGQDQPKAIWEMTAKEFLNSGKFDNCVGSLILMNAVTIGIQADYAAKNLTDTPPPFLVLVERFFCVFFSSELALRLYALRLRFFVPMKPVRWNELGWNYFDFFVVMAQLFEECIALAASSTGVDMKNFRLLRVLRVLRLVRILRVVRVLHLISELRTIVSSIVGSFRSLGWTMVLLLLMIYIVGVYFTQSVTDHMVERKELDASFNEGEDSLRYYFGSLIRTLLSLWQAISGGEDWDRMAGPLIEEVHVSLGFAFVAYLAFATLALMNVVTGFFVHTALNRAKMEEESFLSDTIVALFNMADEDKRAKLQIDDIRSVMSDPEAQREWQAINIKHSEAEYLFHLLDTENEGEIDFREFLSGCLRFHGDARSVDLLIFMQEFRSVVAQWDSRFTCIESLLGNMVGERGPTQAKKGSDVLKRGISSRMLP